MKSKLCFFSFFAGIIILLAGCTTPVAVDPQSGTEQTAHYTAGYFYGPIDADASDVFRKAIVVMDEKGYFRTGELHKDTFISIFARTIGDRKITLRIKQIASGKSELRIRIGHLGNLAESQRLYAAIRNAMLIQNR